MNTKLRQLKEDVSRINLLSSISTSSEDEQDDMLDVRDYQGFETEWLKVSQAVKQREESQQVGDEDKTAIDELREATFKKTYQVTGNGEISGCVSDDFDLIARALVVDYSDAWLDALWTKYQTGDFPNGKLLD